MDKSVYVNGGSKSEHLVGTSNCAEPNLKDSVAQQWPLCFDNLLNFGRATATHVPRVARECRAKRIFRADEIASRLGQIGLCHDSRPDLTPRRIIRRRRFTANTTHRAHNGIHRQPVTAEQDCRRNSVTRNIGTRTIHHMRQVEPREYLLDQL